MIVGKISAEVRAHNSPISLIGYIVKLSAISPSNINSITKIEIIATHIGIIKSGFIRLVAREFTVLIKNISAVIRGYPACIRITATLFLASDKVSYLSYSGIRAENSYASAVIVSMFGPMRVWMAAMN